jgi:hypothetical protein
MKSPFIANSSIPRRIAVGLGALILAACGGGGGGGGGGSGGSPAPGATASVKYALSGGIVTPIPEGVVLEDGNGNTVAVAVGDTSFKFKEGQPYLDAGATYKVSVKTQPKGYACTVENNTGTGNANAANSNVFTVAVRCNGLPANQTYVTYTGQRDASFGFQSFAMGRNGDYFVTIASELQRIDATGKMHRLTLLDHTTGAPMPDLSVRDVAVSSTGIIYLAVQRNAEETAILRVRQTATDDVYLVQTMAESFVDSSSQRRNFGVVVGMSVDSAGNLYVADKTFNVIRKISSDGVVTSFAGSGVAGVVDGTGAAAAFHFQNYGLSMSHDANDNLYVEGDFDKNAVRKISPSGVVTTLAIPVGYQLMSADKAGNLYFLAKASNGLPSIIRIGSTGVADLLVSQGAVNLDTAPNNLHANAIGYVQALEVVDGTIYVAGNNPMAIYKIKM